MRLFLTDVAVEYGDVVYHWLYLGATLVPDLRRLSLRNTIGVSSKVGEVSATALLAYETLETLRGGARAHPFNSAGTGQNARQFVLHMYKFIC